PGFARELLFGIEQIRLVRFDFTLKYVNLLLADARVDPVASGARLIQLRVCQDECRAQLRADEFDQFVARPHTLSARHGKARQTTADLRRDLDLRAVDDAWGSLRHDPGTQDQKQQDSDRAEERGHCRDSVLMLACVKRHRTAPPLFAAAPPPARDRNRLPQAAT